MRSLEQAIRDECAKQKKTASEITCLQLDSTCKAQSLAALAPCNSLVTLSLCNTGVGSISSLPPLPQLKVRSEALNGQHWTILLDGCLVPCACSHLLPLQVLRLSDNRIASLEPLAACNLVNLKSLDLAGNPGLARFEQMEPLKSLPELKKLALDGCPVKDLPDFHSKLFTILGGLEYLDLVNKAGKGRHIATK